MGDARIVLTTLIDEKLLTPGLKKLYVSYYRKRVYADLLADGSIRFMDQVYTSPVPCALHMKRTLNPSLKTDAGWSSMYSTATGESLKDIKDRLNIRKRGTNVRSAHKEKKAPLPSPTAKERVGQAAIASAKYEVVPKCTACRKEATVDVAECSACHRKTHWKCASPELEAAPPAPWFCEKCLTGQANRILDFLQQTRRVLVERIIELKKKNEKTNEKEVVTFTEPIKEKEQEANEKETANFTESIKEKEQEVNEKKTASFVESIEEDCSNIEDDENPFVDDKHTEDAAAVKVDAPSVVCEKKAEESSTDGASATADCSRELTPELSVASERKANEAFVVRDTDDLARKKASTEQKDAAADALEEKENRQEAISSFTDVTSAKERETFSLKCKENATVNEIIDCEQLVVTKAAQTPSAEEKFLVLIDNLIAKVSSKNDRADVITNTTGAMLVHLEKTQLVQLVESGKREILAAIQPKSKENDEQDDEAKDEQDGTACCNNSEVGALIKIFDLRHQILSSQSQFERTTSALAKRTDIHLRDAETKIMELEESRTVEMGAITKVVDLIHQHSSDLDKCKQRNYYNKVLLESINHRRNYIRSTNMNDRFIPSYRYSTKLMTTSSDQLLLTVLLEKLRDITKLVNEWTKMERHFAKMTLSLNESLSLIGTKRKRTCAPVKLPPTPALFAKMKIPPSRRLIERQIANYKANLNSIRQERAQMRKTLFEILKIAREEHLSEEIVRMTDMLYQKCRDLKAEEEEEQMRLKEEAEAVAKASAEEDAIRDRQNTDDGEASADELEAKKQRLNSANTAFDSNSGSDTSSAAAIAANNATLLSEMKGISLLLGSEDFDAKDSNYNAATTKSQAGNDEDSEEDLEQASRAIADITSSVLPDISGGSGSRVDLLNSSLMAERLEANASRVFTSPGQFMIRGGRGSSDRRDTLAQQSAGQQQNQPASRNSGQNHQSFLDQAPEALNKQQHPQQRPEQLQFEQQRQLGQQQSQLEEHNHELERQLQLEQQRLLEHQRLEEQHHERERQEWDRHERERQERAHFERKRLEKQQRLERQHIEKQRQEQERREQQRREQERLEHERYEGQLIEQQRIEEQHRLEEQQRLEKRQRLEQQRFEHQKKRLEQQRHGEQRQQEQQQRKEKQRRQQEQQRLELELQCQRQEQERQFQHSKPPNLPQVIPPGSSHLQMLSQQQQQQQQFQQQQAVLQQQQHSRQLQHPLYGDMSKGMLMSSGMGTGQQDVYAQQAVQMGMDMHDIVRHQDSSLFGNGGPGGLRAGPPYMTSNEISRSAASQPAPTAPRTSFYGDDGHAGQLHPQAVFGSHNLSGQQRQLSDHHMFTNELQQQQQQPDQPRPPMGTQDFTIGRPYRGLHDNMQQHMDQSDNNDAHMGDWGQ